MTVIAHLHGGDRDGESLEMPWARLELRLPQWTDGFLEGVRYETYRLRPPWRGQTDATYDFQPDEKAEAA